MSRSGSRDGPTQTRFRATNRTRTRLPRTWTFLLAPPIRSQQPAKPHMPYFDWGACPFEGCTYRRWQVVQTATAWAQRDHRSPIVFQVKPREWVRAITGVVITTRPGISKVTNIDRFAASALADRYQWAESFASNGAATVMERWPSHRNIPASPQLDGEDVAEPEEVVWSSPDGSPASVASAGSGSPLWSLRSILRANLSRCFSNRFISFCRFLKVSMVPSVESRKSAAG